MLQFMFRKGETKNIFCRQIHINFNFAMLRSTGPSKICEVKVSLHIQIFSVVWGQLTPRGQIHFTRLSNPPLFCKFNRSQVLMQLQASVALTHYSIVAQAIGTLFPIYKSCRNTDYISYWVIKLSASTLTRLRNQWHFPMETTPRLQSICCPNLIQQLTRSNMASLFLSFSIFLFLLAQFFYLVTWKTSYSRAKQWHTSTGAYNDPHKCI